MSQRLQPEVVVRVATKEDSSVCGQICYQAFSKINEAHGFPCDFPGPEAATGMLSMMFSNEGFYCVVAEIEGRIVGSNCLDERSIIAGNVLDRQFTADRANQKWVADFTYSAPRAHMSGMQGERRN